MDKASLLSVTEKYMREYGKTVALVMDISMPISSPHKKPAVLNPNKKLHMSNNRSKFNHKLITGTIVATLRAIIRMLSNVLMAGLR